MPPPRSIVDCSSQHQQSISEMRQGICRVPVLAIVCAAVFGAAAIGGQQSAPQTPPQTPTPPPVFRAGVDLIQLDVTVVDASGRPVHGLTRDDFTLIDR